MQSLDGEFGNLTGALSARGIGRLIQLDHVRAARTIAPGQIQPASLDLRLSDEAFKMPGAILPLADESVRDLLPRFSARPIDLSRPVYFDRGQVYLCRLEERLSLPSGIAAYTNSKSSTGRIDLQTRTISDKNPRYEKHRRGYQGDLWLEVVPKSFDIRVARGVSLNQAIFFGTRSILSDAELIEMHNRSPLVYTKHAAPVPLGETIVDQGLLMSIDLDQPIVGYVAKKSPQPILLDDGTRHDPIDFFEPIRRPKDGRLFLTKEHFYILSTLEYVRVPKDFAVEMLPHESTAGEFRAHYAGFFDPGFGYGDRGEVAGTPAVLEVRPYEDLILRHGQPICRMAYERLTESVDAAYGGKTFSSHYADQRGPRLSKYFSEPDDR
jgi:dCTP deaminase